MRYDFFKDYVGQYGISKILKHEPRLRAVLRNIPKKYQKLSTKKDATIVSEVGLIFWRKRA